VLAPALLLAALAAAGPPPEDAPPAATAPIVEPGARVAAAQPPPACKTSWFALPVVFWLPETKLGYGATGGLHHRLEGAARPSSIFLTSVYTLQQQGSVDLAWDVYGQTGALFTGRARLVHFPDAFYGVGPRTHVDDREAFTRRFAEAQVSYEWALGSPAVRAGPRIDVRRERIIDVDEGGELAAGSVPGAYGFSAAGLGGSVTWDTRDGTFWPARGAWVQAAGLWYPGLGDRPRFARGGVEGRQFLPLGEGRVLGLAAAAEGASADTPFTLLPRLGSTRYLRGWREGRFRDRLSWWAQSELRVPITGRWAATAFAGLGDIAPRVGAFSLETVKTSAGLGARFRLTPEGANVRVDVAASRAGVELYVLVLEAF
jgi:hypothetical protein